MTKSFFVGLVAGVAILNGGCGDTEKKPEPAPAEAPEDPASKPPAESAYEFLKQQKDFNILKQRVVLKTSKSYEEEWKLAGKNIESRRVVLDRMAVDIKYNGDTNREDCAALSNKEEENVKKAIKNHEDEVAVQKKESTTEYVPKEDALVTTGKKYLKQLQAFKKEDDTNNFWKIAEFCRFRNGGRRNGQDFQKYFEAMLEFIDSETAENKKEVKWQAAVKVNGLTTKHKILRGEDKSLQGSKRKDTKEAQKKFDALTPEKKARIERMALMEDLVKDFSDELKTKNEANCLVSKIKKNFDDNYNDKSLGHESKAAELVRSLEEMQAIKDGDYAISVDLSTKMSEKTGEFRWTGVNGVNSGWKRMDVDNGMIHFCQTDTRNYKLKQNDFIKITKLEHKVANGNAVNLDFTNDSGTEYLAVAATK